MKKAIIFDYDGVIVDSFVSVFAVYKKTCQRFGVSCPETLEDFRKIYGYNYRECLSNLGVAEKDFPEASGIYKREIIKIDHELFLGIREVIEKLSKKYKLYLISASHSEEVCPKIASFGLTNFFEKIYCGNDNRERKSEMFLDLFKEKNYSPTDVISIGDRAVDYEVAKKVGLADEDIILVTYGWGLDRNRIGHVNIANNPGEILSFIE
ncbi:MAG TPA: HAD family hydrolase [Candidatus Saccharimonadales bacterium]|nr:HAD family hydrolase [Candidatus Saccharimonadales bacterium]